jgi:thiamine biosynthesis protein ThiI
MSHPEFIVNVLVLKENVLVFTGKEPAFGGLPFGSSGRSMVLLSGGIDSPVAAWLMMRRGSRPDFVHFYSGNSIEEADVDKIKDLVKILARYASVPLKLFLVPVVPYEMRAIGNITDNYDMVMFRRFMVKTAARLAWRNSCLGLVTGDSLGQVASQTMHNLGAISSDVELPILRPLIGMDKMEITAWSKKIGAFATSILPYRDCCSIRSPKPILTARARDLLKFSEKMDLDGAVREAADLAVKVKITSD